jgi:hypothetical protein
MSLENLAQLVETLCCQPRAKNEANLFLDKRHKSLKIKDFFENKDYCLIKSFLFGYKRKTAYSASSLHSSFSRSFKKFSL